MQGNLRLVTEFAVSAFFYPGTHTIDIQNPVLDVDVALLDTAGLLYEVCIRFHYRFDFTCFDTSGMLLIELVGIGI